MPRPSNPWWPRPARSPASRWSQVRSSIEEDFINWPELSSPPSLYWIQGKALGRESFYITHRAPTALQKYGVSTIYPTMLTAWRRVVFCVPLLSLTAHACVPSGEIHGLKTKAQPSTLVVSDSECMCFVGQFHRLNKPAQRSIFTVTKSIIEHTARALEMIDRRRVSSPCFSVCKVSVIR